MKPYVQCVVFVAAGLLTWQLFLVAPAQEIALSPVLAPRPPTPPSHRLAAAGTTEGAGQPAAGISAKGETTNPGKADGKGDPALGGNVIRFTGLPNQTSSKSTLPFPPNSTRT